MSSRAAASHEQPVPGAHLLGQRVLDQVAEAAGGVEQQLHRLLDHPAGDVLAGRVDRHERAGPVGVVVGAVEQVHVGVGELLLAAVLPDRAGEHAPGVHASAGRAGG